MPGMRPESSGPVCAVTAWRTSTRRVGGLGFSARRRLGRSRTRRPALRSRVGVSVSSMARQATGRRSRTIPRDDPYDRAMTDVPSAGGPPETVLDPEPDDALRSAAGRARAGRRPPRRRRRRRAHAGRASSTRGRSSALGRDDVEAYAYFRVGYHRGLDRLRQSGWRGIGLRALARTRRTGASCARSTACGSAADAIGERRRGAALRRVPAPARPGLHPGPRVASSRDVRAVHHGRNAASESAVKRALITGITGQDGRHLSQFLAGKGYQVFGLVHGQANPKIELVQAENPALELVEGDLRDLSSLIARRSSRCSPTRSTTSARSASCSCRSSRPSSPRRSPASACCACSKRCASSAAPTNNPIRFYQASSSEMFGKVRETPQTERTPFHPRSPYGVAKVFGHYIDGQLPRGLRHPREQRASCFNHEGPRRGLEFVTRKVTNSVARIKLGLQDSDHARQPRLVARLGLRRRLRRGDVDDAPAGRARRLRDRDRRDAHDPRVSSTSRSSTPASTTGRRTSSRTRASTARPRSTC